MKHLVYLVIAFCAVLTACSGTDSKSPASVADRFRPNGIDSAQAVNIKRMDIEIGRKYMDMIPGKQGEFILNNSRELTALGQIMGFDSIDERTVELWATWPATTAFLPEVEKIFPDISTEEQKLGRIIKVAEYNNIPLPAHKFVAVTWGLRQSIVFNDSIMFIALNHYLGPLNRAYNGWPQYERQLKTRDMLPLDMAEAITATAMPYNSTKQDVYSHLLYNGAMALAKMAMVPGATEEMALGLMPQEYAWAKENAEKMKKALAADNNLYSTDAELIHSLFALRPSTPLFGQDSPGRAARYVGYQLTLEYLQKHPDATLEFLLSPAYYDRL